jgi:hypothetical protein
MIATASYHANGQLELNTPYRKPFVDRLKESIPADYREWRPDEKVWMIEFGYHQIAIRLFEMFYPDGEVQSATTHQRHRTTTASHAPVSIDPDRRLLYVNNDAPQEVVSAAYRALSKLHHPDRGGDLTRMQQLNDAYARLRDRGAA